MPNPANALVAAGRILTHRGNPVTGPNMGARVSGEVARGTSASTSGVMSAPKIRMQPPAKAPQPPPKPKQRKKPRGAI